jgi:hypothetical protein
MGARLILRRSRICHSNFHFWLDPQEGPLSMKCRFSGQVAATESKIHTSNTRASTVFEERNNL